MALRDINLVPAPQLEKRHLIRHLLFWSGCLAAVLVLIALLYWGQFYLIETQKLSLTQTGNVALALQSKVENVRRLQADQEKLNQQKAVMDAIIKKNQSYSLVLFQLSRLMNNNTWLAQLTISGGKEKESADRLLLTGFSLSNEYLGDFLTRLSQDPLFKNVVLKFVQEGEKENTKQQMNRPAHLIQFQIECSLPRG